jgi:hypothetical protein
MEIVKQCHDMEPVLGIIPHLARFRQLSTPWKRWLISYYHVATHVQMYANLASVKIHTQIICISGDTFSDIQLDADCH